MLEISSGLLDNLVQELEIEYEESNGTVTLFSAEGQSVLVIYALLEKLSQEVLGSSDIPSVKDLLEDIVVTLEDDQIHVSGLSLEVQEEPEELDSFGEPVEGDHLDDEELY